MLPYLGRAIAQVGTVGWGVALICVVIVAIGLRTNNTKGSIKVAAVFHLTAMVLALATGVV